jgi:DNA-directed RNA polymerase sigma subunit (sigma70/sigma32)
MPFTNATPNTLYIIYTTSTTYAYTSPSFVAAFVSESDRDAVLKMMSSHLRRVFDFTAHYEGDTYHARDLRPGESLND